MRFPRRKRKPPLGMAVQFPFDDPSGEISQTVALDWPYRWECPSDQHFFVVVGRNASWFEGAIEDHERCAHGLT